MHQAVGRALHPFGHVAVPEEVGLDGVFFGEAELEGTDTPCFGEAVVDGTEGNFTVQLLLIKEEATCQLDLMIGNKFHSFTSFQYSKSRTGPSRPEGVMGIQWEKGSLTLPTKVLATSTVMVLSPFFKRWEMGQA